MALGKDKELANAAAEGNLELVMEYAQFWGDPKYEDSAALRWAAGNGHTDVVSFLIPLSNPNAERGFAIKTAAVRGYTNCVELLLECTDLNMYSTDTMNIGTHALFCAAKQGYYDIVDLIFERVSNEGVKTVIKHIFHLEQHSDYLERKLLAREQHKKLNNVVGTLGVSVHRKI